MNIDERLSFFQDMILCCHNLYLWSFDDELQLLQSSCPDELLIGRLLMGARERRLLLDYVRGNGKPILMTNELGMMWVADRERTDDLPLRIHVLGPFFVDAISAQELETRLLKLHLPAISAKSAASVLHALPIVSMSHVFEYTAMLHFCITLERVSASDLHYQESERTISPSVDPGGRTDAHGTYEMEREMVRMVREGNLDYQQHMGKLATTGTLGKLANGDASRQMKNTVLVCIVLFSRAAIEGGLSPEIAMTLTDHYFQSVEACESLPELGEITRTMQDDFVQRVHRCRTSRLSRQTLECCDYINMHLDEALSQEALAARFQYSRHYFCHKFKQEVGMGVTEYIRRQRLERAVTLLKDNSLSVQDISERLHFCSQSYFAECFKKVYGVSPSVWREQGGKE